MEKIKTILVTGATGFIGRHVSHSLLASGYKVRGLVRNIRDVDETFAPEPFVGDILSPDSLAKACENVDVVVHLAGLAHANNISRKGLFEINVRGTELLLAAAVTNRVKRFIFISSSLAAGADERGSLSSYGASKRAAEELIMSRHNSGCIEAIILRPVNVYGPGMHGNIASLIRLVSRRLIPPLPRISTRISLVGVKDFSEVIKLSILSKSMVGGSYLVTDGRQYLISDIEREIYRAVGREVPGWKVPRFIFWISIVVINLLRKTLALFSIRPAIIRGLSMRTYHNLVIDSLFDSRSVSEDLGFEPRSNFYGSLPEIVDNINRSERNN